MSIDRALREARAGRPRPGSRRVRPRAPPRPGLDPEAERAALRRVLEQLRDRIEDLTRTIG
ncbi:MAG: hypothetical protein R3F59_28445 [Myxococcota bacterium]